MRLAAALALVGVALLAAPGSAQVTSADDPDPAVDGTLRFEIDNAQLFGKFHFPPGQGVRQIAAPGDQRARAGLYGAREDVRGIGHARLVGPWDRRAVRIRGGLG